jgi:hypothetical protein
MGGIAEFAALSLDKSLWMKHCFSTLFGVSHMAISFPENADSPWGELKVSSRCLSSFRAIDAEA